MGKTATSRPTLVENVTTILSERHREIALLVSLVGCTFSVVSLVGYSAEDPTWLTPGSGDVLNPCGPVGALLADILFQSLGYGAWVVFGGMVLSVLALAGRTVWRWGTAMLLGGMGVVGLSLTHLVLRPGDAFPPGGLVGAVVSESLETAIGPVGAWLVLLGAGTVGATILFQIRWRKVFSRVVDMAEHWLPRAGAVVGQGAGVVGGALGTVAHRAAHAGARSARRAGSAGWGTVRRMGSSLVRGDGPGPQHDDDEDDYTSVAAGSYHDDGVPGGLEVLDGDPGGFAPASHVDPTAIEGGVALAEVQWTPTEEVDRASEVLQMFPELTPRSTTSSSGASVVERDEPTRVSDDPVPTTPSEHASGYGSVWDDERTPPSSPERLHRPAPVSAADTPMRPVAFEADPIADLPAQVVFDDEDEPSDLPPPVAYDRPTPGAKVAASPNLASPVADDGGSVGKKKASATPFELPKLSLLDVVPPQRAEFDSEELRLLARRVEEVLESFKVKGEVTEVRVGPVVTTFEFVPERGISVRKVAGLADDLAMGLRAMSVRIVAPIPGKGCVGIEIPSPSRLDIYLRELMASSAFRDADMALPVVLGKDVEGGPVVADLARMPHLLVGGTTGAGKSVGVNGMLMSLLFTKTPDELRLLLVDPKKLEFKIYEDIPHLLHPVVTEPKHAAAALEWACREMDNRYELLARWDTRNISGYNKKVEREMKSWTREKALKYKPADWPDHSPPPEPEKLPYIVIVIDELADLMLCAKKEVEGSIARLTQMARACGIHLIVATQRPSVDVVTGLIKSNLPTRISFKLRSGTDSRTILDQIGAEALLGRGDMLYLPNAGDIARAHGAFVSDDEVGRVVDFLRAQAEPDYIDCISTSESDEDGGLSDDEIDELFDEAVQVVLAAGKASTSMIQRHLKIGYNRAARIVDQMEMKGVVGPADGARPREVLI